MDSLRRQLHRDTSISIPKNHCSVTIQPFVETDNLLRNSQVSKMAFSSSFVLLACVAGFASAGEIITSPPATNWGDWGEFQHCPNGSVIQGFQLKTEPSRGALIDDSALNGVRAFCGHPLDPDTVTITSSQGSWGDWGHIYSCGTNGSIVGFQLRVEQNGVDDETATNNVRFMCSNMDEPNNYIEGDGLAFGIWRGAVRCGSGEALCGIQTQVQADRGALLDDTSMNNLSAECCEIPAHIEYFK